MLLKIIFEFVPGHCTVVLRRHLLRSFILFYLTGADCINRLIQCNTGSLKHWNFDLSSSVSFVSHCTSSPESLWDSCNLFFFSGSSFWDLLYACKWAFPALSVPSWSFPLHSVHLFWHTFHSFSSLLPLDLDPFGLFFHAQLEVRSLFFIQQSNVF